MGTTFGVAIRCISRLSFLAACLHGSSLIASFFIYIYKRSVSSFLLWFYLPNYVPSKFEIHNMSFELQVFKLRTLLTKVHIIISKFLNSLGYTTSGFNLYSNELIGMHLGLILWGSCMDLPNMGLGPIYCAELF